MLEIAHFTAAGRAALPNGDIARYRGNIGVVTDGIGGLPGGEVVADLLTDSLLRHLAAPPTYDGLGVRVHNDLRGSLPGGRLDPHSGACFAAVRVEADSIMVARLGDVRVTALSRNTTTDRQLQTTDDVDSAGRLRSWIGPDHFSLINPEQVDTGPDAELRIAITSDGVHTFVGREAITSILRMEVGAATMARLLVEEAVRRGSADDATAMVLVRKRALPNVLGTAGGQ